MPSLIFATNNIHKVQEINIILHGYFDVKSLKESGIEVDIPEPHDTLETNATEKSSFIYNLLGKNCFSEDTGLEVYSLNGEPGVKSARYAGEDNDFNKNIDKLLGKMKDIQNRSAQFKTVISLILDGKEYQFTGICKGMITKERKGSGGFGYDPVFIPEGSAKTFAEMRMEEKNMYSHRKKATAQLITFLRNHYGKN
ncbi:MAG: RdgB/HAM1 family non-canonical purine NTP pyrophosphatase [Ferruginibacter sp.]|nr:RdgB/HAM1 family non-canonical purine NTP pyrophosphatase [Ferruginibacter sp.]